MCILNAQNWAKKSGSFLAIEMGWNGLIETYNVADDGLFFFLLIFNNFLSKLEKKTLRQLSNRFCNLNFFPF